MVRRAGENGVALHFLLAGGSERGGAPHVGNDFDLDGQVVGQATEIFVDSAANEVNRRAADSHEQQFHI